MIRPLPAAEPAEALLREGAHAPVFKGAPSRAEVNASMKGAPTKGA